MKKKLATHVFDLTPSQNSGEGLTLTTKIYDNGDAAAGLPGGIYMNQELTLNSYCNSATFNLVGAQLTPALLRKLADELAQAHVEARCKVQHQS